MGIAVGQQYKVVLLGQLHYHRVIHLIIVCRVPEFDTVNSVIYIRTKVSDTRVAGVGDEPEGDIAGKVQLHQVKQRLVNLQEYLIDLLAGDDQYLIIEIAMDYLLHFISVGISVMLCDGDAVQSLSFDCGDDLPHDVRGRMRTGCCLTTMGMQVQLQTAIPYSL